MSFWLFFFLFCWFCFFELIIHLPNQVLLFYFCNLFIIVIIYIFFKLCLFNLLIFLIKHAY
jgi:hypothetical protein